MQLLSHFVWVCFGLFFSGTPVYGTKLALVLPKNVEHHTTPTVHSPTTSLVPRRAALFVPGSIYRSEVSVPVLGPQSFVLKIIDENTARIWIHGVLKLDDSIRYTVDEMGKISFVLTDKTKRILRRFGTRLGSVGYDAELDEARLEVQPPLPVSIILSFKRDLSL